MITTISNFKTRFYNQIAVVDNKICKTSSCERIATEYAWFKEAKKIIPNNIPEIYSCEEIGNKSKMTMSFVTGSNLYQWAINNKSKEAINQKVILINSILLRDLYKTKYISNESDIKKMYFEKPLMSLEYFYKKYPQFQYKNHCINGKVCNNPYQKLKDIYYTLESKLLETDYVFIHGDLTLSNILIDDGGCIFFIDPRGAFGNTKILGDKRYDIAKLYYSLVGKFDSINNNQFKLSQTSNNYQYDIEPTARFDENSFWKIFSVEKELIKFIHCTIWLSLLPHLQESNEQTITAYLHGTYLINNL